MIKTIAASSPKAKRLQSVGGTMMLQIRASRKSLFRVFLPASCVLSLSVLLTYPAAAQGTQSCDARFQGASPADPPTAPTLSDVSAPTNPNSPINPTLIPADECESANFNSDPIPHFDDYSWRAFIALVWPAKAGQRGVPDPNQPLGAAGVPSVFETYKTDWETFQPNAQAPTDWNSFSFGSVPCSNAKDIQLGDMVLASFHEFGNVGEAGIGNLVNVLVAQNRTYVVYLAAYNSLEFNLIAQKRLYDAANLPPPGTPGTNAPVVPSPIGAMTLKSSWIDMTGIAHPERFHTRTAWVKNLGTGVCEKKTVGLVGLHIVQKTPNRPQWIWSTFEQVDNVPDPDSPAGATFNFNNGDGKSMPTSPSQLGPDYKIGTAPASPPPPFNVDRQPPDPSKPAINSDTKTTNSNWQKVLKQQGSVWQFYKLIMTQWPIFTEPGQSAFGIQAPQPCGAAPGCDGSPENTFPGTIQGLGAPSAFANATLETFDQRFVSKSCMACHNSARKTDFVWSLPMLASNAISVAQTTPTTSQPRASALRTLQAILEQPR
ncbi:MAG: hypothetical protein JOY66_18325 [Acetobacteraceae bacterium]|nr:hypothetical protein [Acetobacteraceae bacterium]